jgi:hypothetical protein
MPFMRGAFAGEMARGRRLLPILGNRHTRPFGKKSPNGRASTRDLNQEPTMPEESEPL